MDLGITQKEAARRMGADQWTVINWEKERTPPAVRLVPAVVQFLGYDPFPKAVTISERLRAARRRLGLSQAGLAERLRVDEGTIRSWERERHRPSPRLLKRLARLIGGP